MGVGVGDVVGVAVGEVVGDAVGEGVAIGDAFARVDSDT